MATRRHIEKKRNRQDCLNAKVRDQSGCILWDARRGLVYSSVTETILKLVSLLSFLAQVQTRRKHSQEGIVSPYATELKVTDLRITCHSKGIDKFALLLDWE